MSQERQSNVPDGKNTQPAQPTYSNVPVNHQRPKSCRSLFKENRYPRVGISSDAPNVCTQNKHSLKTNYNIGKRLYLQPSENRASVSHQEKGLGVIGVANGVRQTVITESRYDVIDGDFHWSACNDDVVGQKENIHAFKGDTRTCTTHRSLQDNVMYQSRLIQNNSTKETSRSKKSENIQDNVMKNLKLNGSAHRIHEPVVMDSHTCLRQTDHSTISHVQDNIHAAYEKSHSSSAQTCKRDVDFTATCCSLVEGLHVDTACLDVEDSSLALLLETSQNWFDSDRSAVIDPQSSKDAEIETVRDNHVFNSDSRTCFNSDNPAHNWNDPAISGSEWCYLDEVSGKKLAQEIGGDRDKDADFKDESPEQWLVQPLQRLIDKTTTDHSEYMQDTSDSMATNKLASLHLSQLHYPGQIPCQNPQQYTTRTSVHRVEELTVHCPVSPAGSVHVSVPSFHQMDHLHQGDHRSQYSLAATLESTENPLPDVFINHQQQWSDATSKEPTVNLDVFQETPQHSNQNDEWFAPESGIWLEVHGARSRYSHISSPVNTSPLSSPDTCGLKPFNFKLQDSSSKSLEMESFQLPRFDKNRPASRYFRQSSISEKNYDLPLTTSTLTTSSQRGLNPYSRNHNNNSDFSETGNADFWEFDKLDDTELYRLSEADEFIHMKPREGLYARSAPFKHNKNSTYQHESETSGKRREGYKPDKTKKKEREDIDEDKDKDTRTQETPSKNSNNNKMDADRYPLPDQDVAIWQQQDRSPSEYLTTDSEQNQKAFNTKNSLKINPGENVCSVLAPSQSYRSHSPSRSLPNDQKDMFSDSNRSLDVSAHVRERTNSKIQAKVSLSPSAISINTSLLETKLQYSLTSEVHVPQLHMMTSLGKSSLNDQIYPRSDSAVAINMTKVSPYRHSLPEGRGIALTMEDLKLSVSPSHDRENARNHVYSASVSGDMVRKKLNARPVKPSSTVHVHVARSPDSSNRAQPHSWQNPEGKPWPKQTQKQSVVYPKTKHIQDFGRVPKPKKSAGIPKKSHAAHASSSNSPGTLSLSGSSSPRRAFSILWAYKILDILHTAPADTHEELVTKLYWFRRWHRKVRLIKVQEEQREELLSRAVAHYRVRLLWKCLQAWKEVPPCHRRAADTLRQKHLLWKGFSGLRWAVSQSRMEIEGAVAKFECKRLLHHFGVWRDIHQVHTERAQLLESLVIKRCISKGFQVWKDRYSMVQKEAIARLHYKVSLLNQGFQQWKLFTSQSRVKGYRSEMSRVHHEEKVVRIAWSTMRAVYIQTHKAKKHFNQKLLSSVLRSWRRGSLLAKAERRHQHSQAIELKRYALMRAHYTHWKEELVVVQARQRLDRVRIRYSWELWILRLQRKQLYRQIMDSQARKVAKQYVFSRWLQVARRQKEATCRAANILRQVYLRAVFEAWRSHVNRQHRLRSSLSTITTQKNVRVRLQTLNTWSSRLRDLQAKRAGHRAWSLKCVHMAVSKWQEVVQHQRLHHMLVAFQPVHKEHAMRDAFQKWSSEYQLAQYHHQRAVSAQQVLLRNRLLRFLLSWRLLAKESKTIAPLLDRKKWKQLANSFDAWRSVTLRRTTCRKHQTLHVVNIVNGAFIKWREQATSRKKLLWVQKCLLVAKLRRTVLAWRQVSQHQTHCRAFQKQHQDVLVRDVFDVWRQTFEKRSLQCEVEQGNQARRVLLMTIIFKMWSRNAQQQKEAEDGLVSEQNKKHISRQTREAYKKWRRQLLVQNIVRNVQAGRVSCLMHRIIQAWHKDTRSTYEQMTERFHMAYDAMGTSFANDISPESSPSTLALQGSLSSSSAGSHCLPAYFSTADSGYCGNGLLPVPPPSTQYNELSDHQERLLIHEDCLRGEEVCSLHQDDYLELRSGDRQPSQVKGFSGYEGASGRSREVTASLEDLSLEDLALQLGSPRLKGSQPQVKAHQLPPIALRFDNLPQAHATPQPINRVSFMRRRASLDQSLLGLAQADQRGRHLWSANNSGLRLVGSQSPSHEQSPPASPIGLYHLRTTHRKSQTGNPILSSMEEGCETDSDSPIALMSLSQHTSSLPQSPESPEFHTPTHHTGVSIPLNTSPPPRTNAQSFTQTATSVSISPSLTRTSRTASPEAPFSPTQSKSLSPLSPITQQRSHILAEIPSLQKNEDNLFSQQSSVSDGSSLGLESLQSSSYYMQLVGSGHDLSQSVAMSEYAASVFSESLAPVIAQVDQRTYMRSIVVHWLLWPASAAFNQWLDYTRYRQGLRQLTGQASSHLHQQRLHCALNTWQRRHYVERLARNHWERRTKAVHLLAWAQHNQVSKQHSRQTDMAEKMATNRCLMMAYNTWKTKYKKHQAVLSIVHNWKGYVKQTFDLEDRAKGLRHEIRQRSIQECFIAWKMQTWQSLEVKAHYNCVVTHRCLVGWSVWSKTHALQQQKLHIFKTKRLKLQVLHHWKSQWIKLQIVREFHRQAVAIHLKNIMRAWRRYAMEKHERETVAMEMIQERNQRLVQEYWMMWKKHTTTSQQMHQLYVTNLANKHLQAWHAFTARQRSLHLTSTVNKNRKDTCLKSYALYAWKRAYQANQLATHRQASLRHKLVSNALSHWMRHTQRCRSNKYRQKKLLQGAFGRWKYHCFKQQSSRTSILRIIHHWRSQTQQSKELDQSVTTYLAERDTMRRKQALGTWRLAWQQQTKAKDHCNSVVLLRCMDAWHTFAAAQRQRLATLEYYQDKTCRQLVSSSFAKWRQDYLHSQELEKRLAVFCQQRAVEMLARVVQEWHHTAMEGIAQQRYNTNMKAKALIRWQKSFSNNHAATQLAEAKQTGLNMAVLKTLFVWSQARKSEKECQHSVEALCYKHSLQAAFTLWKTQAHQKAKARAHAHQVLHKKVLQAWVLGVRRAITLQALSETTKRTCTRLRLQSATRVWMHRLQHALLLKHHLKGALRRRDQAMLQEAFTHWRRETRERRANKHRECALLKQGWSAWKKRVKDRVLERQFEEDVSELADEHYNKSMGKRILWLWSTEAKVARLKKKRDTRLAKKYGDMWRHGCKMEEMARYMDVYWSVKNAWSIWRRYMTQTLMSKTMQQRMNTQVRQQMFQTWQRNATRSNNSLHRDVLNRHLYSAFKLWREQTQTADDKSCTSSISCTSSSGASELAGIWINAQKTGSV